jgi:hypothetical protein
MQGQTRHTAYEDQKLDILRIGGGAAKIPVLWGYGAASLSDLTSKFLNSTIWSLTASPINSPETPNPSHPLTCGNISEKRRQEASRTSAQILFLYTKFHVPCIFNVWF